MTIQIELYDGTFVDLDTADIKARHQTSKGYDSPRTRTCFGISERNDYWCYL